MKILRFILPAALLLAGCSATEQSYPNSETPGEIGDVRTMRFTSYGGTDTKTELSGNSVVWSKGTEKIMVYAGTTRSEFTATIEDDQAEKAIFKGKASSADAYYAIYPSSAAVSADGSVITANFPTKQTVNPGGMPKDANLSVAKAEINGADSTFYFMNAGVLLKFQIKESEVQDISKITSVRIKGLSGEKLSGKASITVGEPKEAPSVEMQDEALDYVELQRDAEDFKSGTFYYVVIPPVTFENGFKVEFMLGDDLMASTTASMSESKTLERAKCYNMGEVPLSDPAYKWVLVDGKDVTVSSGGSYALAYPDDDDPTQYYLFSFQKYMNNAYASDARKDLASLKLSKLKNRTKKQSLDSVTYIQMKADLYKILREEGIVGNYCTIPASGDGASKISVPTDIEDEVSMVTTTVAFGYDSTDVIRGTFSSTVDGTELSLNLDSLACKFDDNSHVMLSAEPDSLSIEKIYVFLRGSRFGFTWDQLVTGEAWITDGTTKQKWDYVSTAMGDETIRHLYDGTFFRNLYEKYNLDDAGFDRAIGYLPKADAFFQYYPHYLVRFNNMIFDKDGAGFIPVLCFDLNALGTYAFAAIPAIQGVAAPSPTWGTEQVRTRSNNMNWGSTASSDLTGHEPYHWVNAADDGVTYTKAGGTSTTDIWPTYNYDEANKVYLYKKTSKIVGAKE